MFGRNILDKASLISQLESMQRRHKKYGNLFTFETYLGLTFASGTLVDELAVLVKSNDREGFAKKMYMFQDRFRKSPKQIRDALVHYLGKRHGKLASFGDLPGILNRLKK